MLTSKNIDELLFRFNKVNKANSLFTRTQKPCVVFLVNTQMQTKYVSCLAKL